MTMPGSGSEQLDAALGAARNGDERGFEVLYDTLNGPLFGFVRQRGASDPEELVNAVLFSAFSSLDTFVGDFGAFRSFVFRIARNRLIDGYRSQSRSLDTVPLTPDNHDGPDRSVGLANGDNFVDQIAGQDRSEQMLSVLTDDQREVIALRIIGGLSLAETAEALDKPVGAIKSLQRRALRTMHRHIGAEVHQ